MHLVLLPFELRNMMIAQESNGILFLKHRVWLFVKITKVCTIISIVQLFPKTGDPFIQFRPSQVEKTHILFHYIKLN